MNRIAIYIKESYNELINKVTWPTASSLQSSTILVLVASMILALLILVMDLISKGALDFIYGI